MKINYTVHGSTEAEIERAIPVPARQFFGGEPSETEVLSVAPYLRRGDGSVTLWEASVIAWGPRADA